MPKLECKVCEVIARDSCKPVRTIHWSEKSRRILLKYGLNPDEEPRKVCEIFIGEVMAGKRGRRPTRKEAFTVLEDAGVKEDFQRRVRAVLIATGYLKKKKKKE